MPTVTLGTLSDQIADELGRTDLDSQIQDAIRSANQHYLSERWGFNELTAFTLSTTSSIEFYALPTDFAILDSINLVVGGQNLFLDQQHYDTIQTWQTGLAFGQPTDFAIYGQQLDFYPIPNDTWPVVLAYVQNLSTLTATACTNALIQNGEALIRHRARAEIQLNFLRDDGITAEYTILGQQGLPFYTYRESAAYTALRKRFGLYQTTGRIRGSGF